jgi:hypothetical protein
LGETIIEPHPGDSNQFAVFCRAIGSTRLTATTKLTELWATVPQVERVAGLGAEATPVLGLNARQPSDGPAVSAFIEGPMAADLPPDPDQAAAVLRKRLAPYPGAADTLVIQPPYPAHVPVSKGPVVEIAWRSADGTARAVELAAPGLGPEGSGHYLWPGVGARQEVLKPLAAWWVILLALSSVARYEPDLWLAALARDQSVLAIPIEEALAVAREMLPWFILHALRGEI